jgi:hypothetical protein
LTEGSVDAEQDHRPQRLAVFSMSWRICAAVRSFKRFANRSSFGVGFLKPGPNLMTLLMISYSVPCRKIAFTRVMILLIVVVSRQGNLLIGAEVVVLPVVFLALLARGFVIP